MLDLLKDWKSGVELLRYGLIGILSNSVGYIVYLLITHAGASPKITMTLLYAAGATVGFFGNRKWTFSHEGNFLGAGVRYVIAHGLGYLINLALLLVLADHFRYPHQWVQAFAIFIIAGYLFLTFKFFVFPKTPRQLNDQA